MAIQTFNKTETTQLTNNFKISEFHCKGTSCGCTETLHDTALSSYLQLIRNHFGKPVYITSGYRCPTHNASVGGVSNSRHTQGKAADFYISGITPLEIAQFAESIGILGIGCYDSAHGNFVHIDTRTSKSFWKNTSNGSVSTFFTDNDTTDSPNEGNTEGDDNTSDDTSQDTTCCSGSCGTIGMVPHLSTNFIGESCYVTEDNMANIYVITCSLNYTSPYYTVVLNRDTCIKTNNNYQVRIGCSDAILDMKINSDKKVTFTVVNTGGNTGQICYIAAYY